MTPTIRVVAAVITQEDGLYLVTQRRPTAVLPLLWEFPGGKVEPGESDLEALKREVRHRVGVEVEPGAQISTVSHSYEHYAIELHLYECRITEGKPKPVNVHQFRWVESADFDDMPFTPSGRSVDDQAPGFVSCLVRRPQLAAAPQTQTGPPHPTTNAARRRQRSPRSRKIRVRNRTRIRE